MVTTRHIVMQAPRNATRNVIGVEDPDEDVCGLVRNGNMEGALRRLMQRHGAAVYRYCREALRDRALAEDVHQQVFIEAFRGLARFEGRATARTWLFKIARNRVIDAGRARSRRQSHLEEAEVHDVPDPRPLPGESIDDPRLREALVASLEELGHDLRTAVLLRYQQGFTFEEMAEICREKPGTLQARVTRAVLQLRARIEARMERSHVVTHLGRRDNPSRRGR
jgi:RNA polymerase sigma-70 factor (ECF subfamily)